MIFGMDKLIGHNLLIGKRGLIFGVLNEQSLAWAVARRCHAEGASLVLTNTEAACKLGTVQTLAGSIDAPLVVADATSDESMEQLLVESQRLLGGPIDFILHAVAQAQNMRRHRSYDEMSYTYMQQTLNVSALSFHRLLQTARRMDAIRQGGSVVALTYIGAERSIIGYEEMADAKAMLQSIARNFGRLYADRGVRVNTVSQSPTVTKAGAQVAGQNHFLRFAEALSPLGNADAASCGDLCAMLFSDFSRKVTMQNIYNDGGFSSTGMTDTFIRQAGDIF